MKNRMTMLLAFLAAFMLTSPAMAASPEEDEVTTEEKADEADTDATEETAGDAKAEDAEVPEEGTTEGEDAKTEDDGDVKAEIEDDEEAVSAVEQLVGAAQGGQWALVAALAIMLLVYLLKRFGLKERLPSKLVPWVAAGMSMAGYVAAALMVDGVVILDAVLGGLATGAAAVGLWEMLFKHFLGGQEEASAES